MVEDYKSNMAKSADIEYRTSYEVSKNREDAIIRGVSFNSGGALNPYQRFLEEIKDYNKQISDVTVPRDSTFRFIYTIGDKLGLSSPKSRLKKISLRSVRSAEQLEGKINDLWKKIDKEDEKHRELRGWKHDAGLLMDKYEAIKKRLYEDTEKMKNDIAHVSDELQKAPEGSTQYITLGNQLDRLSETRHEMELDLSTIERKATRSAASYIQFSERIKAAEVCRLQFQRLQSNYESLRNQYQLQATKSDVVGGTDGIAEGMKTAGNAYGEIQNNSSVLNPLEQLSNNLLVKSANVFAPDSVNVGDNGALKALQKGEVERGNEIIKTARELRRQEILCS